MPYYQPQPVVFVTAPPGTYYDAQAVILVGANGLPIDLSGGGGGTPTAIDGGTSATS